jgi:cytochrome c-type biogenesis protein CcmF
VVGTVLLSQNGQALAVMHPEKREYFSGGKPMTEAAIRPGLLRDIYVVLGEPLDAGAWSLRVQSKPGVRWIWLGAIVMALGGLLGLLSKRQELARGQA